MSIEESDAAIAKLDAAIAEYKSVHGVCRIFVYIGIELDDLLRDKIRITCTRSKQIESLFDILDSDEKCFLDGDFNVELCINSELGKLDFKLPTSPSAYKSYSPPNKP